LLIQAAVSMLGFAIPGRRRFENGPAGLPRGTARALLWSRWPAGILFALWRDATMYEPRRRHACPVTQAVPA